MLTRFLVLTLPLVDGSVNYGSFALFSETVEKGHVLRLLVFWVVPFVLVRIPLAVCLGAIIDSVIHPPADEHWSFVLINGALHALNERDPMHSFQVSKIQQPRTPKPD